MLQFHPRSSDHGGAAVTQRLPPKLPRSLNVFTVFWFAVLVIRIAANVMFGVFVWGMSVDGKTLFSLDFSNYAHIFWFWNLNYEY